MTTTKGVKLDQAIIDRLESLAQIRDRSAHWLMCAAIKRYLEEEEAVEREKREDRERWERYQLTGAAIPHTKAAAWLEKLAQGKSAPRPRPTSR